MIGKTHIISFFIIAFLYLTVAVWKYSPVFEKPADNIVTEQVAERDHIIKFWEYYNAATSYRMERDYEKAAIQYEKALEIQSNHEDALYYLGSMYLFQKRFKQTEEQWSRLEEIQQNSPRTHLQLGTLYFCHDTDNELYNPEKAFDRFERAWKLNREETGPPLLLSKILILNGNHNHASELLNTVISSNHMSYEAVFLHGYIEWLNSEENRAMAAIRNASNIYQSLFRSGLEGEGATAAGARAMLSEDRFCDPYELKIRELLESIHTMDYATVLKKFDQNIENWRQ